MDNYFSETLAWILMLSAVILVLFGYWIGFEDGKCHRRRLKRKMKKKTPTIPDWPGVYPPPPKTPYAS